MPQRAPRICTHPGCRTLTLAGRCEKHPIADKASNNRSTRERQARRYLATNSVRWRRIRAQQLARKPLCEHCLLADMRTPATHVDHINGDTYNNQPGNLQSLCASCHSLKTAREDGGFGNRGRGG